MRCLGLDIGNKRSGVALSDPMGILATPLLVFEHTNDNADINIILDIVKKNGVELIIVGLPQSMDGSIGSQAEKVKYFTNKLKLLSPIPVEFRDERLTTVAAKHMLEESGSRKTPKNKKIEYDALAAAIILQSYLNEAKPLSYPPEELS